MRRISIASIGAASIFLLLTIFGFSASAQTQWCSINWVGDYIVEFRIYPNPIVAGEESQLLFSILNKDLEEARNITVSIAVFDGYKLLHKFPKRLYSMGDLSYTYTFPDTGEYTVLLNIFEGKAILSGQFTVNVERRGIDFWQIAAAIPMVIAAALTTVYYVHRFRQSQRSTPKEFINKTSNNE